VKRSKAKNAGMVARQWFALLRTPDGLPVLFASRRDAEENRDDDEYLVVVMVRPASLADLGRGERAVLERRRAEAAAKKTRPRIPDEQKRRRGSRSGVSLKLQGVRLLQSELKKLAPKMRQRFKDAIEKESRSVFAGVDLAKGRDRSAEIKVTNGNVVSHRFIKNAIKKGAKRAAAPRARR
jgi:hypothetical protein